MCCFGHCCPLAGPPVYYVPLSIDAPHLGTKRIWNSNIVVDTSYYNKSPFLRPLVNKIGPFETQPIFVLNITFHNINYISWNVYTTVIAK